MKKFLTQNESMFCQAIANVSLMAELFNNDFLHSEYYNCMDWSCGTVNQHNFQEILSISGLGNPAMLQMFMYSLLVMPKELLGTDFCKDKFNEEVIKYVTDYSSTYPNETNKEDVNYYRHIRNAIAHSKCDYSESDGKSYVTFKDNDTRDNSKHCEIKMQTGDVGRLFEFLMTELMKVLNNTINVDL